MLLILVCCLGFVLFCFDFVYVWFCFVVLPEFCYFALVGCYDGLVVLRLICFGLWF